MSDIVNERLSVAETVKNWGYFDVGIATQRALVQGRRVLEIALGGGPWGVAATQSAGAEFYAGVDALLTTKRVRDFRSLKDASHPAYDEFPYSPEDIMRIFPNIKLFEGSIEQNVDRLRGLKLDTAILSGVLERMRDPLIVLKTISESLERDGILWISHGNYYAWSGHGLNPRSPRTYDESDAEQRENADWQHLAPSHKAWSNQAFNRIRLHDLRDIISKYFEIVDWSPVVEATERLSPQKRSKLKQYSLADLTHERVYITARKRNVATWKSFSGLQLFHPKEDYLAAKDHSRENNDKYKLAHHVLFSADGKLYSHSDNDFAGRKVISQLKKGQKIRLINGKVRLNLTVKDVNSGDGAEPTATFIETLEDRYLTFDRQNWRIELPGQSLEP